MEAPCFFTPARSFRTVRIAYLLIGAFVATCSFIPAAGAQGKAPFSETNWPIGNPGFVVSAADFTNDGWIDIAAMDNAFVSILVNNGAGAFLAPVVSNTGSTTCWPMAPGDFNGDGKLDVVISTGGGQSMRTLAGNGAGLLSNPISVVSLHTYSSIAVADFNNDGLLDAAACGGNNLTVYKGLGAGALQMTSDSIVAGGAFAVMAGDIDGAGLTDVVVHGSYDSIYLNFGHGLQLFSTLSYPSSIATIQDAALADGNQDGNLDIFTGLNNRLSARALGAGDGTFATPTYFRGFGNQNRISAADITGDGIVDIAGSSTQEYQVAIQAGSPTFSYFIALAYNCPPSPGDHAIGDVDNDGLADVIVGSAVRNEVGILHSNGNGTLRGTRQYRTVYQASEAEAADLNLDGIPDPFVGGTPLTNVGIVIHPNDTINQFPLKSVASGQIARYVTSSLVDSDGIPDILAVVINSFPSTSVVYYPGLGNFDMGSAVTILSGQNHGDIVWTDLNNDTISDLVVAGGGNVTFTSALHLGNGSFQAPLTHSHPSSTDPGRVRAADFDGDGIADVVTGSNLVSTAKIITFRGVGNGTFQAGVPHGNFNYAFSPAVGDLNMDGALDVAFAGGFQEDVGFLLNNGSGTFVNQTVFPVPTQSIGIEVVDVDLDARPDFLIGLSRSDGVGDLGFIKNLGGGAFAPTVKFWTGKAPGAPACSDLNLDGKPDALLPAGSTSSLSVYYNNQ